MFAQAHPPESLQRIRRAIRRLVIALGFAVALPAIAQQGIPEETAPVRVEVVAAGLDHPWGLALLPDGRFLVTERNSGQLRLGDSQGRLSEPLEGVPEVFRYEGETERSQAGLFDVKLHPDFETNRLVYLSFSKPTPRGATVAIVRARLSEDGGSPRLEAIEDIFEMKEDDQDSSGLHFGGRMALDPSEDLLYLSVGERRNLSRAQDVEDQAGSILRMTRDGDPAGLGQEAEPDGRDPFVWSWGHRNPQALGLHPGDGTLWIADHGPRGGDEVNRLEGGQNHGWPLYTGGVDYSGAPLGHESAPADVVPPFHVFEETVAPSGLAFYRGSAFPDWEGDLLIGGLVMEGIVRVPIGPNGALIVDEARVLELDRRVRDVQIAPDGSLWVVTEHSDGEVIRVSGPGS